MGDRAHQNSIMHLEITSLVYMRSPILSLWCHLSIWEAEAGGSLV